MINKKSLKWAVAIFVWVLFAVAILISISNRDWFSLAMSFLGLILSFLLIIFERRFDIDFSEGFEIFILLFIYSSLYLGELKFFYAFIWWWDLLLHGLTGIATGFIAFSLVYILNKFEKRIVRLSPFFVALFAFCFAMAIGSFWEIFEFSMDTFFGFNMQKSGLNDTMGDLIVNFIGAFIASTIGYFYMRKDFFNSIKFFKRFFYS